MDGYHEDLDKDINRFKEDLSMFEVPTPQTYWREVTAKKSDTSAGEEFKCKQNLYMAHMQQQQQQQQQQPQPQPQQNRQTTQIKFTQKTLVTSSRFNPGSGSSSEHMPQTPSLLQQQLHQHHAGLMNIRGDSKPPIPMLLGQPGSTGVKQGPLSMMFSHSGSSSMLPPPPPSFQHAQNNVGLSLAESMNNVGFMGGFPHYPGAMGFKSASSSASGSPSASPSFPNSTLPTHHSQIDNMGLISGFPRYQNSMGFKSSPSSGSPSFPNCTIPPPPPPPPPPSAAAIAAAHAAVSQQPPGLVMASSSSTPTMIPIQVNSHQSSGTTVNSKQPGSNYSSPRSSLGSGGGGGDSKNSSPRTSLISPQAAQPTPLHVYEQRFGSPRSSITSSRSSISAGSVDSKHSSPRASLTGPLYDRFPSPRGSLVMTSHDRQMGPHHADGAMNSNTYPAHLNHPVMMQSPGGPRSILGDSRFNEPAPPHIFNDPRYRTHPIIISSSPSTSLSDVTTDVSSQPIYANTAQFLQTSTAPSTTASPTTNQGQNSSSTTGGGTTILKPNIHNSMGVRLPLYYETIPPKQSGPSEAEKKLAVLTQQLENEMRISTTPRKSTDIPKEPPPPYHGPHKTEPMPGSSNSARTPVKYASAPLSLANDTTSVASQSTTSHGYNSPTLENKPKPTLPHLTYQVTPGPSKGPSEAEKKLAALTQQLEDEMENNPQGEYYGKFAICSPVQFLQVLKKRKKNSSPFLNHWFN